MFGTKGGAKLNPEIEMFTEINDYLTNVSFDTETALSIDGLFTKEIEHFVDCIMNGTECISPATDGIEIKEILDAIYESAKTNHEVIL